MINLHNAKIILANLGEACFEVLQKFHFQTQNE